jgi:hypothetical protein
VLYYFNSKFSNKINKITSKADKMTKNIFIDFVCDFIDFVREFNVKIIEHTVASCKTSDFMKNLKSVD